MLLLVVASAVAMAAGACGGGEGADPRLRAAAADALAAISELSVVQQRRDLDGYDRSTFGTAWSDAVRVAGGRNGCDTRNDVLARDLTDTRVGPLKGCARAVLAGELRSPYSGAFVVFRRAGDPSAVQIDHIVPLAYAWDMGASSWSPELRADFANDPANLVAVDGAANQDKGDAEPGRWMPPERGFWCQYAIQFVRVSRVYGLAIDVGSRAVLAGALRC